MRPTDNDGFALFDWNPKLGRSVWIKHNGDGTTTMRTDIDADPALELNRLLEAESHGKRFGEYRHIGSVPAQLDYQSNLSRAHGEGDHKWVNRWFNDGDNRGFRASRGRV
jgi:hypothetical protein